MRYRSTRGGAAGKGFADVLLDGLAPDGGLYVPEEIPPLPKLPSDFAGTVAAVTEPFVAPDPLSEDLGAIAAEVYARFRHPDVAPLRELDDDRYLLELFWGPTLSFKDYALQLVGELFERVLSRNHRRLVILGATSGDTGSAAIEACRGRDALDIVILYPDGAVSEVQRRQMTTVQDANVRAVAVEGTFDDCQRLVKEAFTTLGDRFPLGAINSINWARIMAQAAYYAYAVDQVGPTRFVVPTGNFGNIYASHIAARMGVAITGLTVANNANHGLTDLISTGRLQVAEVERTLAPAMDIQVPSNLERFLYEVTDADTAVELQERLRSTGILQLPPDAHRLLADRFEAGWRPDTRVQEVIAAVHADRGILIDPHTAVAWDVADDLHGDEPCVIVSTAHPAKFGEAVAAATGVSPRLPDDLAGIMQAPERITRIPADLEAVTEILAAAAS